MITPKWGGVDPEGTQTAYILTNTLTFALIQKENRFVKKKKSVNKTPLAKIIINQVFLIPVDNTLIQFRNAFETKY